MRPADRPRSTTSFGSAAPPVCPPSPRSPGEPTEIATQQAGVAEVPPWAPCAVVQGDRSDVPSTTLSLGTDRGVATVSHVLTVPGDFSRRSCPLRASSRPTQGERKAARDNKLLRHLRVVWHKSLLRGVPQTPRRSDIDANGIVHVREATAALAAHCDHHRQVPPCSRGHRPHGARGAEEHVSSAPRGRDTSQTAGCLLTEKPLKTRPTRSLSKTREASRRDVDAVGSLAMIIGAVKTHGDPVLRVR